ncbi:phage integrase central domain-containing protein [Rhodoferax sp.]|uniref:tyrosine-type recombinase/integrase n=1 Tax=Rhodoferax sp. TaxID=50421 RepID=UPI002847F973|nr:integrase arm-type DNA-binding domain-containing protein [Rhodoferax sp.]MDR3369579.1 integrase arm-type DNA-binding domain-containing protein [Rhodoferax sp.]
MPKVAKELSAVELKYLPPGAHAVGGVAGLILQVTPTGGKTWILRVRVGKKRREIGLGGFPSISLAAARSKAKETREAITKGVDPVAEKQATRAALLAQQASTKTFSWCVASYLDDMAGKWKNAKHAAQWRSTLETYANPIVGALPVRSIELTQILEILRQPQADMGYAPLWDSKNETASRLRGRVEKVLDWAAVHGYRSGLNPARWRAHLDAIMKSPRQIQKSKHHESLPHAAMYSFMQALRQQEGTGAKALEFAILCASRSGEVRGATWSEIDLVQGLWTIPGNRMKAGKPHTVPLSKQALQLLGTIERTLGTDLVFPSPRGKVLSDMTLTAVLRRMQVDAVPHGFRSTFRTWAGDQTAYPHDLLEFALAHALKSEVEGSYMHGTQIAKRRGLMQTWADFVDTAPVVDGNVIPFKAVNS